MTDITHDGPQDGFHEIQLSGKHLVFLFMLTTVVSVLIFLTGVFVGRNARSERQTGAVDAALTTPAPAPAPTPVTEQAAAQPTATPTDPPSPPADDELTYRKRLESVGSPAEKLKPPSTTVRSNAKPNVNTDVKPAAAKPEAARSEPFAPPRSSPAAAAPAGTTSPETSAAGAGGRPGRWVVQLVALRDRGAASSIVQRLSGKGYPAFIVNPAPSTPNQVFKVQVGRYDDRGEAEQIARRLEKEEKFNPWISR